MKSEGDKWEELMGECRMACRLLQREFIPPKYQNWHDGRVYHDELWALVRDGLGILGQVKCVRSHDCPHLCLHGVAHKPVQGCESCCDEQHCPVIGADVKCVEVALPALRDVRPRVHGEAQKEEED